MANQTQKFVGIRTLGTYAELSLVGSYWVECQNVSTAKYKEKVILCIGNVLVIVLSLKVAGWVEGTKYLKNIYKLQFFTIKFIRILF